MSGKLKPARPFGKENTQNPFSALIGTFLTSLPLLMENTLNLWSGNTPKMQKQKQRKSSASPKRQLLAESMVGHTTKTIVKNIDRG